MDFIFNRQQAENCNLIKVRPVVKITLLWAFFDLFMCKIHQFMQHFLTLGITPVESLPRLSQ